MGLMKMLHRMSVKREPAGSSLALLYSEAHIFVSIPESLCDREVSSFASCHQSSNSVSEGKCYLIHFTIIRCSTSPI